jgi:8-oxo-dGTP pyrophosphatase MutT (NUDIX family)
MKSTPISTTLIFCPKGSKILLLERKKEPLQGYWLAPGGKIEPGESPHECAQREFYEETGLTANNFILRGLVLETSPLPHWQWLLHIYVVTKFRGPLKECDREGNLRWWELDELKTLRISDATRVFLNKILMLDAPVYEATYLYDSKLKLYETREYTNINPKVRRFRADPTDIRASTRRQILL